MFSAKNCAIYVLDDSAFSWRQYINAALLKRGYIFAAIGVGITGDIQVNDTDIHNKLKDLYFKQMGEPIAKQLRKNPGKTQHPRPSRDKIMMMTHAACKSLPKDCSKVFKLLWITGGLDGNEEYLVSERVYSLKGAKMIAVRQSLMRKENRKTLKQLTSLITPSKEWNERT